MTTKLLNQIKDVLVFAPRSVFVKRCMCNHIDVNKPVLELVIIENSAFKKN